MSDTQPPGDARPRRLLALDGGGIRGVLTLSILKGIETQVGRRLSEYFDYIAGTSTGAIIAAGLARGMSVDELIGFYRRTGPRCSSARGSWSGCNSLYRDGALQQQLQDGVRRARPTLQAPDT